eukprot:TRINITY_DN2458_c0_g1_i1.p1 TRINITY_DN2458_c0_g1~~TRINITY_DN2458_c0_g1_i1.p1  ORF type:complete len:457 (+),score=144.92 TRINITY_DN2458_c0_g1_i1:165-1535(+)
MFVSQFKSISALRSPKPQFQCLRKRYATSSSAGTTFETSKLSNGVKVVTASSETAAATVGLYFNTGSRFESGDKLGVTGVLRRLAFQGTQTISAVRLAREFELLPANYNVGVGREQIAYNSEVTFDNVYPALNLLTEAVVTQNPTEYTVRLQRKEVERDTHAVESDPKTYVFELAHREAYRGKGLGNSVYTPSYRINKINNNHVSDFIKSQYNAPVLVATGGVDHQSFVSAAEELFGKWTINTNRPEAAKYQGGEYKLPADIDTHFAVAFEGASIESKDYAALSVLRSILGGGSSKNYGLGGGHTSRLYKAVSGNLASEVEAFNLNYTDSGLFGVFGVSQKGKETQAVEAVLKELQQLSSTAVSAEELSKAKLNYRTQVLFNNESRSNLSDFLAAQLQGKVDSVKSPQQFVEAVESVSAKDVQNLAQKVFKSNPTFVAVGEVSGLPTLQSISASLQ